QIPIDPATGQLVQGDVVKQTDRAMQNLKAVLAAAGASFDDVVKTTIYVADLNEFTQINETYGRYFQKSPPARATVQMAALPQGARVEIECVAATGGGARSAAAPGAVQSAVQSALAPKAIGPYSQGTGARGRPGRRAPERGTRRDRLRRCALIHWWAFRCCCLGSISAGRF